MKSKPAIMERDAAIKAVAPVVSRAFAHLPPPAPRKRRASPEADKVQKPLVALLTRLTIKPARFWFVPNGGNLSKAQRGKFKAMGLTPGVSDLHFIWSIKVGSQTLPCYGVIECKADRGDESDAQVQFGRDVVANGHTYAVARSPEEALAILAGWEFPLKSYTL